MFDEIEKFLRQAAEAAAQQQGRQAGQGQQRRPQQPPQQQQRGQRPIGPPQSQRRPQRLGPDVEIVDAQLADDESPIRSIARDFRSSASIAEHTRHLGEEVGLADEHLEEHLHEVFDHKVGTIRSSGADVAASVATGPVSEMTKTIMRLLASPNNMRASMLLGEILRRPEERW